MQTLFEICCGSAEDAMLAYRAGANRVELNSDLFHGGLTPTLGSLIAVKKAVPALEIMGMVRPREGGFCYTDTEYAVMKEDARIMLEHGTDGIVFGFLHENGTVTICHSHTKNLKEICKTADILVVAVGKAKFVTGDMVKPGAVVIDVGMNRDENGKLCGDVDYESAEAVAGYLTPVPGGVGPMTITMLMKNAVTAAKIQNGLV